MKQENLLGVDVSARELVVAIRRSGKAYPLARFPKQRRAPSIDQVGDKAGKAGSSGSRGHRHL